MARAWKNKHGLGIGGLLIDTLAYNFLQETAEYDEKSFYYYDLLSRDFFKYLSEQEDQDYYYAPGSGQRVRVKKRFQKRAKKAYRLCLEAIEAEGNKGVNDKWKRVYGRPFPASTEPIEENFSANAATTWTNTEQFIEDYYPVDIRYTLKIDCAVKQNGYRESLLRDMILKRIPLFANKQLTFSVVENTVPQPYHLEWKVLNRGEAAQRRNCIRGQIVRDNGNEEKNETTNFKGDHLVECYAIKSGIVVAKDRIHVPIDISK
jgi:hypothetical protein